eukprot:scaffold26210_cov18-Tisochrysis_lutea.AAC.2
MHLHALEPLCARLLAACASLCGAAVAPFAPASPLSSLAPSPRTHHSDLPGPDHLGHHKQEQQLVQDLITSLSHAQHDLLQVDAATQLHTSPQAILQVLQAMRQSMKPSQVRAVMPPLPQQPQQATKPCASSAGSGDRQCSSIEGTSCAWGPAGNHDLGDAV